MIKMERKEIETYANKLITKEEIKQLMDVDGNKFARGPMLGAIGNSAVDMGKAPGGVLDEKFCMEMIISRNKLDDNFRVLMEILKEKYTTLILEAESTSKKIPVDDNDIDFDSLV